METVSFLWAYRSIIFPLKIIVINQKFGPFLTEVVSGFHETKTSPLSVQPNIRTVPNMSVFISRPNFPFDMYRYSPRLTYGLPVCRCIVCRYK